MLREQRCWSAWYQCVPVWFWFWFGTQGAPALTCSPALTITTSSPIHCCFHPKMSQNKQQQHPQCTFFHALLGWLKKTPQNQANTFKNPHPTAGTEQNTGGSLQWFPLCSFPLGRLAGKLLHSFHPQKLLVLFPKVIFSQPIRFPECTHHSWQGNALRDWAALPAWPCQGGKWFPPQSNFLQQIWASHQERALSGDWFLQGTFSKGLESRFIYTKFTPWPSPGAALRAEAEIAGVHRALMLLLWFKYEKKKTLYPNVSHFWSCLTSLDIFKSQRWLLRPRILPKNLGLFQVRPSGLRQKLLLVTGLWCCCCDLNTKKPQNLYPNVPHFWSCLASSDLF